ncbi:MAG: DUF4177 domain-containing protein [Campylobacterales bacterium]|nr:DUF4177 domain-containing protein [Campylobacterales bacterium]
MAKEYKVVKYKENILKAILFGQARVSPRGFTKFLNRHSKEGWGAVTIDRSVESVFWLFSRENYVIVFEKEAVAAPHKSRPKHTPQEMPSATHSEL